MIFSVIIICVLGRDFGCMLKAERTSKPGPTQTTYNGTAAAARPTTPCPSINRHNDATDDSGDDDELESSVDKSERGEGCCCHSSSSRRRRGRGRGGGGEGNEAAITGSAEMRRCGSEARDEDLDESVFTGQYMCVTVCM